MLEEVVAFERKMTVFARDLQRGTLTHIPYLRFHTSSQYDKFRIFVVYNYRNANIIWERVL